MIEIIDEDPKVTRLRFSDEQAFDLCSVSCRVFYQDDHVMLTRVTFRIGPDEWHEHISHEFEDADAEPAA